MKKMKKLVVANWKMNPATLEEARKIGNAVKRVMRTMKRTQAVICPPYVYISSLSSLPAKNIFLGSQDAFYEPAGSYTGEVNFRQLPQFGVRFVILGHSERRARGETDAVINKKIKAVLGDGMVAIVCVGEKTRDGHGEYLSFVRSQVLEALKDVNKKFIDHVVIAYEPVWAIGGSHAMRPEDIHEMSIYIKKTLRDMYGPMADGLPVLYGGSVTPNNVTAIISGDFVGGLLVGHESLNPKDFVEIIRAVDEAK